MAPMMHPRHLYFMGRGIYLGVEGAGTNMSENCWNCWKIVGKLPLWKLRGVLEHPEHRPGYAPGYRPNMQLAAIAV